MKTLLAIAVVSLAALSPVRTPQDALAYAEEDLLKAHAQIEATVEKYRSKEMDKQAVQAAMNKVKNDLDNRDWSKVTGNEKVKAKLTALSAALSHRCKIVHDDCFGSMTVDEMRRDPPTNFSQQRVEIALLDLRLTHLEVK